MNALQQRQQQWLQQCLQRNQQCEYLQRYGVAQLADFVRLPQVDYAQLIPEITRMMQGATDVLFCGPTIAFEQTGGSTSGGKIIPYSAASFQDFYRALWPWLQQAQQRYQLGENSCYFAISPATRQQQYTAAGVPIGLPDGAYLGEAAAILQHLSITPDWIASLQQIDDWYLATLHSLLCAQDLRVISVWSPTFLLLLLDALDARYDELLALLQHGGNIAGHTLPANTPAHERLLAYRQHSHPALWPQLALISCWADASSQPFYRQLQQRLPSVTFQAKGLLATEGVVTVPDAHDLPRLALDSGFYEFIDTQGNVCYAWQLQAGQSYQLLITTAGGLYRYQLGDELRCETIDDDGPVLRFCGRSGLVSDLVGEKLNEAFVAQCLQDVPGFNLLIPSQQHYVLVHDAASTPDLAQLEQRLCANPQYAYARKLGQLGPLQPKQVTQAMHIYVQHMQQQGTRLGDIKIPALRAETHWLERFC